MSDPLVQELRRLADCPEEYTPLFLRRAADALDAARQREEALREALEQIQDVAFRSFRGGRFDRESQMATVHRLASDALPAGVRAQGEPQ